MTDKLALFMERLPELTISFAGKLLIALLIFFIGRWIAKGIAGLLKKLLGKGKMDGNVVQFLGNLAYGIILAFVIIAAIAKLGVQTTSLIAVFGAATLAVGMALQGTLGNFASGVMLLIFRPFKVGDSVIAGGINGIVSDIGIFATTVFPGDGRKVIIPNGKLSNDTITNFTTLPTRRIELSINVPGTSDINAVRDLLRAAIDSESDILKDPAPAIIMTDANAAAIVFGVFAHVNNKDYGKVHASLTEKIKLALNAKGIWA
ncbi:MAG: mechanosensitive ion channel [Candidatus Cloacimonetes bacterium]|jgi:small conductance mechanosensitive channel|nr:mechanosensitive ion channel [Candidatus Cloacimonadota bacterium]MDY0298512.1 mechanosensitive ion channel [Candidatus Cloacimonadaceae bacterium]MCB5278401.1 mechanosensitive ion channel [Candidatus Cloacimonadota bacterium]MDD2209713.1 mechanosensitive ion channel [Candidatus Cloacimonadota bacterium]MDD3283250.1 mechanosensitive ion channel [Candidatus Cloacimonadota bacterium]